MGTACICYKQQKPTLQLVPLGPGQLELEQDSGVSEIGGKNKFVDIRNESEDEEMLSELNLNVINNELSRYLIEFQLKNGVITNRFTQRLLQENSKTEGNKLEEFPENKENIVQSEKENELYLPLTNENIDDEVQPSFNSDNQCEQINNKSCLLSLSSHILNESLFTDRAQVKSQFYELYSIIGEKCLPKWCDNNRISYEYELADIEELKEIHFDSKFMTCLQCFYLFWQSHYIHLLTYCQEPTAVKVYMNGDRKMFTLSNQSSAITLQTLYEEVITKVKDLDIANLIYFLTGWMPEHIYLSEIKNFAGILERLSNNLQDGNTLITFSRQTKFGKEHVTLTHIDFENGLILVNSRNKRTTIPDLLIEYQDPKKNLMAFKFQNFIQLYDMINLNWNPFIYEMNQACSGIINEKSQVKKFLLVIPPSSQDLQIRLFFQRHQDFTKMSKLGFTINLYEYDGTSDTSEMEPIRTIETREAIYSDVFIFEYCKEKTQYLLTVRMNEGEETAENAYFTLTLYSFAEMKFKELEKKPCLIEKSLAAAVSEQNVGFGINSPYFNKNLQFSVETQMGRDLEINISASNQLVYEICLIPDPQKKQNLTKLKLEDIINHSEISGEKRGRGTFVVKTAFSSYLLMINAYSRTNEQAQVNLKLFGKEQSALKEHLLNVEQILNSFKPLFTQEVKWLPTHSGPRKRLKSNSTNSFQPTQTFMEFFKNPLVDKKLIKGTYQFFVKSETFRDYFDSVESYEDKNACEPPALSMAIFLTSQDKKSYKIIVDDAFYVPFGVGFWTCSIELEEGAYRFIFPKMDKGFSKGTFGIIKN